MGMILGIVRWGGTAYNALEAYHRLTRDLYDEDLESIDLLRGRHMEADIAGWYWEETGHGGRAWPGGYLTHPDYPAFVCHPDFEVFSTDGRGPGVLEVKAPRRATFSRVYESGLRQSEIVQLQTYLAVSGRGWGAYAYGNLEHEAGPVLPIQVESDPELAKFLLDVGQRFWDNHVRPRVPPDPDDWRLIEDTDAPDVVETTGERKVVHDPEIATSLRETLEAKAVKSDAENLYRERKKELQRLVEGRAGTDRLQVPGVGKVTIVRNAGRESFSRDALEAHKPIDRDKLWRWLQSQAASFNGDHEELLTSLELDLDAFVRLGKPYSYPLPTEES